MISNNFFSGQILIQFKPQQLIVPMDTFRLIISSTVELLKMGSHLFKGLQRSPWPTLLTQYYKIRKKPSLIANKQTDTFLFTLNRRINSTLSPKNHLAPPALPPWAEKNSILQPSPSLINDGEKLEYISERLKLIFCSPALARSYYVCPFTAISIKIALALS